jgi:hypothetical protein
MSVKAQVRSCLREGIRGKLQRGSRWGLPSSMRENACSRLPDLFSSLPPSAQVFPPNMDDLPNELILHVFSYLQAPITQLSTPSVLGFSSDLASLLEAGAAWAIRRSSSCEDMLSAGAI